MRWWGGFWEKKGHKKCHQVYKQQSLEVVYLLGDT